MTNHEKLIQSLVHTLELSTTRSMHDWGHFVRDTGLSMPQVGLLMRLYHHGGCGVTEISRHSGVTNAAASQLVDRLVEKQLVERTEGQRDRRMKQLSLTAKGIQLVETSIKERYQWVGDLISHLSAKEQEDLQNSLPALVQALQALDASSEKPHPPPII
jgi:MarR family 2-MHQ and catechol resistance regulon transcriptional repressor